MNNKVSRKHESKMPAKPDHSAIASWSGYIYQGLCAVYHVLYLYYQEGYRVKDYSLALDSYEDFAIMDNPNHIASLHQCKCYKNNKMNFSHEFEEMRKRKQSCIGKGLCDKSVPMFFHTNGDGGIDDDVVKYAYVDGSDKAEPDELYDKIEYVAREMNKSRQELISVGCLKARVTKWIDEHVLKMHRESFKNKDKKLFEVATSMTLSFSDILNMLDGNGFGDLLTNEEVASYARVFYIKKIEYRLQELLDLDEKRGTKTVNENSIRSFINALALYPLDMLSDLFVRLNPHSEYSKPKDFGQWIGDNPNTLFKVINGFEEVDAAKLHWMVDGKYETPSTFSRSKENYEYCIDIWNNRLNLSVLYDYDWIVGDVNETTRDILSEVKSIMAVDEDDPDSIFSKKKIGILSIEDKYNGKYN